MFARLLFGLPRLASASGSFFFSTHFYLLSVGRLVAQRVEPLLVSALHDRCPHARNCIGLLSNTALLISTGNKYLCLLQCHSFHGIHPPQLQQLRKGSVLYSAYRCYSAIPVNLGRWVSTFRQFHGQLHKLVPNSRE